MKKVVCLENWNEAKKHGLCVPVKGEIYTIRAVVRYTTHSLIGDIGVGYLLEEIVNDPSLSGHECTFEVSGFRPVDYTYGKQVAKRLEEEWIPLCQTLAKMGY